MNNRQKLLIKITAAGMWGLFLISTANADSLSCASFNSTMANGTHDDQVPYLMGLGRDAGIDTVTVEPDGTDMGQRFVKTLMLLTMEVTLECSQHPKADYEAVLKTVLTTLAMTQMQNN